MLAGGAGPVPRRFVDQARALAADFATDDSGGGWLLHTDLHCSNVLRGIRDGRPAWVAIDPKPVSYTHLDVYKRQALLVAAYRRATALAGVAGRATGVPLAPEVTQRHTRQAQVLRAILETGQVPERIISGPPGSTATATSGPTAPVDGTATTASTSCLLYTSRCV